MSNSQTINNTCWQNHHYTSKACDSDELQCIEGSKGPLCGSCDIGYVYQQTLRTCVDCSDSSQLKFLIIFFSVFFMLLFILLITYYYDYHGCHMFDFILNMERGSLKVRLYHISNLFSLYIPFIIVFYY